MIGSRTIRHALLSALVVAASSFGSSAPLTAQVVAHREVPRGEVTGLEMAIDGHLEAIPGGRLRWFTTLYEVIRGRDLRPAPRCELRLLASFSRGEPVATAITDATGHAVFEVAIPEDLEQAPHLILEARSPRGVRRTFEVDVTLRPRYELFATTNRLTARPGGDVLVMGRVLDRTTGEAAEAREVVITTRGDTGLERAETIRTDRAGVFVTRIRCAQHGAMTVTARSEGAESTQLRIAIDEPTRPRLVVSARPTELVFAPGSVVTLDVEVRTPEGAPIAGAEIDGLPRPPLRQGAQGAERLPPILTDRFGIAHFHWQLPAHSGDRAWANESGVLRATATGIGTAQTSVQVRVSRRRSFGALTIEGGALVPDLPARIYARVVSADGMPISNRDLELDAAFAGTPIQGHTNEEGIAVFDVPRVLTSHDDECAGPTRARAVLRIDGDEIVQCMSIDPDALLRVRAPARVEPGGALRIDLARRSVMPRVPVVVTLLASRSGRLAPLAERLVAPGEVHTTLTVPSDTRGEIVLRARPLMPNGQTVRGAMTRVLATRASQSLSLEADAEGARMTRVEPLSSVIVADENIGILELERTLRSSLCGEACPAESDLALAAFLASRVELDGAASAIWQNGELVPQPMPTDPVALGLLRDPWRTRARFVRGRIGNIMRAIETYVDAQLPDSRDEVAMRQGRSWAFNPEMLDAAITNSNIGEEGVTTLDGESLDFARLAALDPAFTYDAVARRITRRRLWRVMRGLAELVRERRLDLPWARRGDPGTWIASMTELGVSTEDGELIDRAALFDGWGQAFVFRRTDGRSQFDFLPVLAGWELVSIGPDGREGTADDLRDPFARVLPTGSLYAEAVGEDELVARVTSVALSRSMLESLAESLGADEAQTWEETANEITPDRALVEFPEPLVSIPVSRAWSRPMLAALGGIPNEDGSLEWTISGPLREHRALAIAFAPDGRIAFASAPFEAGSPLIVRSEMPSFLRLGERVRIPVDVTKLRENLDPVLDVHRDGVSVRTNLSSNRPLESGTTGRIWLELEAERVGPTRVSIKHGDSILFAHEVRVLPAGGLRALRTGVRVERDVDLAHELDRDDFTIRQSLTLAGPRELARALLEDNASIPVRAFMLALSGAPDAELRALIESHADEPIESAIDAACMRVALAASESISHLLHAIPSPAMPSDPREQSAMLLALAHLAPSDGAHGAHDSITELVISLREYGWRVLANERHRPTLMARWAAALLLIDREDSRGRALYEAAQAALTRDEHGARIFSDEMGQPGDGFASMLALAIAARQMGDDAQADELARAIASSLYLVPRLGNEDMLWIAAASTLGALGGESPSQVRVAIGGQHQEITLERGTASLPVVAGTQIHLESHAPIYALLETRVVRPHRATHDTPLRAHLEGEIGHALERSALELIVEQRETATSHPVVEVHLPSIARFDETSRAALLRAPSVRRVIGPDGAGMVRIELAPLESGQSHRLPLVLHWLGEGRMTGLALITYDRATPHRIGVTEGQTLDIVSARESTP
jgi:hypothetical protein